MDGLVVVDKPKGFTSHDVVAKIRTVYSQRRVGHAGTLDPDATGVLLVGLGRVTRLLRFLQAAGKEYRAGVRFGVATSTLDAAGDVLDRRAMPVTRSQVEAVTPRFVGDIEQVPPMVSAVKVGGRRLHDLARRGEDVERTPRRVHIERIELEDLEPGAFPLATLRVACGSGTYIRTLAADLGGALDGFAHVEWLRRLRVGSFTIDESHELQAVEAEPDAVVLEPREAVRDLEALRVDAERARAVRHGMTFSSGALGESGAGPFAVVDLDGGLLAVYEQRLAGTKPMVVVAAPEC